MKFPLDCGCEFEYCLPYWVNDSRTSFFAYDSTSTVKICEKHNKLLKEEAYNKFKERQEKEVDFKKQQYDLSIKYEEG